MIKIEFEEPTETQCECCGKTTVTLTRFVYRDGEAYAVYYAQYTPDHKHKHLSCLISLGEWGEAGTPEDRVAFAVRIWTDKDNFNVGLADAKESPWSGETFLGRILDRKEALKHKVAQGGVPHHRSHGGGRSGD